MLEVVAHYRKLEAFFRNVAFVFLVILLYAFVFYFVPDQDILGYLIQRPLLFPVFVGGSIAIAFGLLLSGTVLGQVIFYRGRAVWIENGRLVFLHKLNLSVACSDITEISISLDASIKRTFMVIRTGMDDEKKIPTMLFVEEPSTVIARLKRAIPTANFSDSARKTLRDGLSTD